MLKRCVGGFRRGRLGHRGLQRPEEGSLTERQLAELANTLARYTTTPGRCVFAVWEGDGDVWPRWGGPRLLMPHRDMVVVQGSVVSCHNVVHVRPAHAVVPQSQPMVA